MSSYVLMKLLESTPERYDVGIRLLSGGRIAGIYEQVAERAAAPGRHILDVGCGTGGLSRACAARGAAVLGIDINAGMLAVARARPVAAAGEGSVEYRELGAVEIADRLAPTSFDAVVSCLAFSELSPAEQRYTLEAARTVLAPGGILVVADEILPDTRAARVARQLIRLPLAAFTWLLTQATTRPVDGLAELVREVGFQDLQTSRVGSSGFAIVSGRKPPEAP